MAPPVQQPKKPKKASAAHIDPFINSRLVEGLKESVFFDFLSSKDVALVMFYDAKEPQCEWSKKHFLKAAKITERENHAYAAVDCVKEQELCNAEGVTSLPYFKMYSKGKMFAAYSNPTTFTYHTMARFVENAPVLQEAGRPKRPCDIDVPADEAPKKPISGKK
ncbi:protein disulfide-isomerase A5-like isoform X1 [Biomphalaria pfeifferi]|uniref:Protein disulfide-isomerase A5-like isoform X1 n=1 Tax=Biomphalaria pfeifferi TaxID=112525 RepID=A0AAD8FKL4_BIOPF|nr:protein disulfide-isomerase A5-like isoform X1 [Biomphalaria pfeifferi]